MICKISRTEGQPKNIMPLAANHRQRHKYKTQTKSDNEQRGNSNNCNPTVGKLFVWMTTHDCSTCIEGWTFQLHDFQPQFYNAIKQLSYVFASSHISIIITRRKTNITSRRLRHIRFVKQQVSKIFENNIKRYLVHEFGKKPSQAS